MARGRTAEKKPKRAGAKPPSTDKRKSSFPSRTLLGLSAVVVLVGVCLVFLRLGPAFKKNESASGRTTHSEVAGGAALQALVGNWIRPDGGYTLAVRSVDPAGRVDAEYFNPRPINVSRAEASLQGKAVRLFVELQAVGYPGSTYELTYDPEGDALAGIYFQAAIQQRFEVVFFRARGKDRNR